MTVRGFSGRREPSAAAPRVGLFGLLGAGNIGNDASMEVMLRYLKADHPDAILDAMVAGPQNVKERHGIAAIPMGWYQKYQEQVSGVTAIGLKTLGKGVDAFRTASWVRRHDVVIVPGAGVLETSLPVQPWKMPYAMLLLCAAGKLFGTKVALVGVGATAVNQRLTRLLFNSTARLAFYRSYRDNQSRDLMRLQGLDVTGDHVYPDLVFAVQAPPYDPGDPQTVAVGLMDYKGSNDDRRQADEIHSSYVEAMKLFVRWLVDNGRKVRLVTGDTNNADERVVQEVLADLRVHRPDLDPARINAEPISSFDELLQAMAPAGTVVATRFHNVICGLRLAKPTISLGYSPKFTALMADMGLSEFCQPANSLDTGQLIEQFTELEKRQAELRQAITDRNMVNARLLDDLFAELSAMLFPAGADADTLEGRQNGVTIKHYIRGGSVMNDPASAKDIAPKDAADDAVRYRKKDFWNKESPTWSQPHYRLEKAARLINRLGRGKECTLLDVGCGPATLMRKLTPNIEYFGVDIAIQEPAPNLIEVDLLENPIRFDDTRFDIVLAQGFFEYVGDYQAQKFAEIAKILNDNGKFIVSYTNFGHRNRHVYWLYNNVQSLDSFRESLASHFRIDRYFPVAHNWSHTEPKRKFIKAVNMPIKIKIPVISPVLAPEYFFICSRYLS